MTQTALEEAKTCPKCGIIGEVTKTIPAPNLPRGTRLLTVTCKTMFCKWYDTNWFVQINPDNTVPAPRDHTGEPKHYVGFEGHDDQALEIVKRLKADAEREQNGGYEIRGRG